jgi:uncharacterized membrane protein
MNGTLLRKASWGLMAFLAIAVGAYALAVAFVAAVRPPIVVELLRAWPIAATVHFAAGAVALVTGAFQVNARLRARYLSWHRWTGRVYLLAVGAGGVAGFVLASTSSAGPVARWGFGVLAVLWIATSAMAYKSIRRGERNEHRDWMVRSYALTLAAVTLRLYLPASLAAGIDAAIAYPAIAWLCWVPNLALAEWLVRTRRSPWGRTAGS